MTTAVKRKDATQEIEFIRTQLGITRNPKPPTKIGPLSSLPNPSLEVFLTSQGLVEGKHATNPCFVLETVPHKKIDLKKAYDTQCRYYGSEGRRFIEDRLEVMYRSIKDGDAGPAVVLTDHKEEDGILCVEDGVHRLFLQEALGYTETKAYVCYNLSPELEASLKHNYNNRNGASHTLEERLHYAMQLVYGGTPIEDAAGTAKVGVSEVRAAIRKEKTDEGIAPLKTRVPGIERLKVKDQAAILDLSKKISPQAAVVVAKKLVALDKDNIKVPASSVKKLANKIDTFAPEKVVTNIVDNELNSLVEKKKKTKGRPAKDTFFRQLDSLTSFCERKAARNVFHTAHEIEQAEQSIRKILAWLRRRGR